MTRTSRNPGGASEGEPFKGSIERLEKETYIWEDSVDVRRLELASTLSSLLQILGLQCVGQCLMILDDLYKINILFRAQQTEWSVHNICAGPPW